MQRIDPHTLYETEELKSILKGHFKIERLRSFGLIGTSKGYWGQNVIDSINRLIDSTYQGRQNGEDQRGMGEVALKETKPHEEPKFIENSGKKSRTKKNQNEIRNAPSRRDNEMENMRQELRRRI